jgi:hypothetical protein
MNRRMPNGTYGGVRGWGREAPAYSIFQAVTTVRMEKEFEFISG